MEIILQSLELCEPIDVKFKNLLNASFGNRLDIKGVFGIVYKKKYDMIINLEFGDELQI